MKACGDWTNEDSACSRAISHASREAGDNFDIYDIYAQSWDVCHYMRARRAPRRPIAEKSLLGQILARTDARVAAQDNNCTDDDDLTTCASQRRGDERAHARRGTVGNERSHAS